LARDSVNDVQVAAASPVTRFCLTFEGGEISKSILSKHTINELAGLSVAN